MALEIEALLKSQRAAPFSWMGTALGEKPGQGFANAR
tara:strand:- start:299 stop:409 length:111 start_codon:yes stop_codon:yes gene_type:complete